jgi:RNA polymerase sigma-70 factor (ECF subfamily)
VRPLGQQEEPGPTRAAPAPATGAARAARAGAPDGALAPPTPAGGLPLEESLGDDALVALLPARDGSAEAALAALYDRYSASVYGLGLRMLGDAGLAEDLLQETFARLWLHAAQYQAGRVRFATWLLRVATNLAISELRRAARRPRPASRAFARAPDSDAAAPAPLEPADPAADVPDQVWLAEQRRLILAALEGLPAEQREAVELAYFGGLTHAEIAAVQAVPLSTVKTRLALGLRKLAGDLERRGLAARDGLP